MEETLAGGEKETFHHLSLMNNVSQLEKNVKEITHYFLFITNFYKNFTKKVAKNPAKSLFSFFHALSFFEKNCLLLIITCVLVVFTGIYRHCSQISP